MRLNLFSFLAALSIAHATSALRHQKRSNTYCKPSQPCWPSAATLTAFNTTLSGRLIKVIPWADPCFTKPNGYKPAQCDAVESSYLDGVARGAAVGTTQNDNWAYCYSNQGDAQDCSLQATAPSLGVTVPLLRTCQLGRISPYAVKISSTADVVKTLAFAKAHNIKVVIKNTGHEYLGRATAPDTIMIWTHNLKSMKYVASFGATKVNAIVLGAGVVANEVYSFAAANGKSITLGAYASVGVAGGFAMGGGHGPLGPKYGLAVDNILQYTIVTADGKVRMCNSHTNRDLFWALRGGGGGVWGVVTEVVYQVYPATPVIAAVFNLTYNAHLIPGDQDAATADYISNLALYQANWTKIGWAGYNFLYDSYISFNQGLPEDNIAAATASMQPFFDYVNSNPKWTISNQAIIRYPTFQAYFAAVLQNCAPNTPVAFSERLSGRLIPQQVFSSNSSRLDLGKAVVKTFRDNSPTISPQSLIGLLKPVALQIYSTGPLPANQGGPSGADTGVNTAWRSSLWEVVIASGWVYGFPQALKSLLANATHTAMDNLRVYGTGCYYSESDVLEEDWQTAFFGDNYAKLLTIKQKYDPNNVFTVWKGIGYAGQEDQDSFRCYQQP